VAAQGLRDQAGWVGEVQQGRPRRPTCHVGRDVERDGDRAECIGEPADPDRLLADQTELAAELLVALACGHPPDADLAHDEA
jgi:hypothetical protein